MEFEFVQYKVCLPTLSHWVPITEWSRWWEREYYFHLKINNLRYKSSRWFAQVELDCATVALVSLRTTCPRISFLVWFQIRVGQKRTLCEIWKAEMKEWPDSQNHHQIQCCSGAEAPGSFQLVLSSTLPLACLPAAGSGSRSTTKYSIHIPRWQSYTEATAFLRPPPLWSYFGGWMCLISGISL